MPQKLCDLILIFRNNPGYLASKLAKDVSDYLTLAKSALLILLEENNYRYMKLLDYLYSKLRLDASTYTCGILV